MATRDDILDIAVDDQHIAGTLVTPGTLIPGVLFVHGWGGSQEQYVARARDIAALGCICLTFDLRGHAKTRSQVETVTREDNLRDVLAAYDTLLHQRGVDASSIAVVGSSYGGYLAAILTSLRSVRWLALRAPADYKDADWALPKGQLRKRQELDAYRHRPVAPGESRAPRRVRGVQGPRADRRVGARHDHPRAGHRELPRGVHVERVFDRARARRGRPLAVDRRAAEGLHRRPARVAQGDDRARAQGLAGHAGDRGAGAGGRGLGVRRLRRAGARADAVAQPADAGLGRAVHAAVERALRLDAVAEDAAVAMRAMRREHVDRALERVERVRAPAHRDGERLVVLVAAMVAAWHGRPPVGVSPRRYGARVAASIGAPRAAA
jgi:pimeloyl-ACP methyl ester carboxylesterase